MELNDVERWKGICYQWKEKVKYSKGDQNSFRHESNDRAQKQNTMPSHLLSHPCHEVEVCRRTELAKTKVFMVPFFNNRADIIWKVLARDRLVNIGILPSVNFTKQKRDAKSMHHRDDEHPSKKQKKERPKRWKKKTTTRVLRSLWKLYHNWIASRKTRSYWILKKANKSGEIRCKKSGDRFEEYDTALQWNLARIICKLKENSIRLPRKV